VGLGPGPLGHLDGSCGPGPPGRPALAACGGLGPAAAVPGVEHAPRVGTRGDAGAGARPAPGGAGAGPTTHVNSSPARSGAGRGPLAGAA